MSLHISQFLHFRYFANMTAESKLWCLEDEAVLQVPSVWSEKQNWIVLSCDDQIFRHKKILGCLVFVFRFRINEPHLQMFSYIFLS